MKDSPVSELPESIDAKKAFAQETSVAGKVPVSKLARFGQSLSDTDGTVDAKLSFRIGERGRRVISGEIDATVNVVCERCLGITEVRLHDDVRLAAVESEEQARSLPEKLDPWIITEGRIDLNDLVEEELMLSMPIVNYHPEGQCAQLQVDSGNEDADLEDELNPFSILKTLKDNSKKH